jgi:hypothetical protein
MATPGQLQTLQPQDLDTYIFLQQLNGQNPDGTFVNQQAADSFVVERIEFYGQQEQDRAFLEQERQRKLAEEAGTGIGFDPSTEVPDPPAFQLTPEQQQQARQSIDAYMKKRGLGANREIPGITPDPLTGEVRTGVPMDVNILERRESIPSPGDIQTQAEGTYASIRQQAANEGLPTRKEVEDMLFMQAREDYGIEALEQLGVMEQTAVESDLKAVARQQSFNYRTADDFADQKISGQFGVGRPRQGGSPFESPPTPRVVPRALDPRPFTVGGILQRDPELVREMTPTEAIIESIKPQTIKTTDEIKEEKASMDAASSEYILDVERRLRDMNGDAYFKASPQVKQSLIDSVIRDDFADFEKRLRQELTADYKLRYKANTGQEPPQDTIDSYLRKVVFPEMRNAVMTQIPQDNPMYGVIRNELNDKYSRTEQVSTLDPFSMMDVGKDLLGMGMSELATSETPFTGEITESVGMAVIRNLNLPFRLVLNPIEEVAVEGIMGEPPTVEEQVAAHQKRQRFYDVPTRDLTEEVSGFSDTFDAYLREVAVENANAYGTGNAFANYALVPQSADQAFVAGTAAEIFFPWGTVAKLGSKGLTGFGMVGRAARALDVAADGRAMISIADKSGQPSVYRAMTAAKRPTQVSDVVGTSYNSANKISYEVAENVEALDAARQYTHAIKAGDVDLAEDIARANAAKGGRSKQIFDAATDDIPLDQVQRLDDDDFVFSAQGEALVETASKRFDELDNGLNELAKQNTVYGDVAKEITREGRAQIRLPKGKKEIDVGGQKMIVDDIEDINPRSSAGATYDGRLGPLNRSGASTDQLVGAAASRLAKYNIQDYVALTDRMAVQKEVFKEITPSLDKSMDIFFDTGKIPFENQTQLLKLGLIEGKTARRDKELMRIFDKMEAAHSNPNATIFNVLDPGEQVYLMNRFIEARARSIVGETAEGATRGRRAAVIDRVEGTERAFLPEELRAEAGARPLGSDRVERLTRTRGITREGVDFALAVGRYIKSIKPSYAARTTKEVAREIGSKVPLMRRYVQPVSRTAAEARRVTNALDQAKETVVRLERALPEAMSVYGKNSDNASNAIYSMYAVSLKQDPTNILVSTDPKAMAALGKSTSIPKADVENLLRITFPNLQPEDLTKIRGVSSPAELESLALEILSSAPRLEKGMLTIKAGVPDTTKPMILLAGDNAAKFRIATIVQEELSQVVIPLSYRGLTREGQDFMIEQAVRLASGEEMDFFAYSVSKEAQTRYGLTDIYDAEAFADDIITMAGDLKARGFELNMTPRQIQDDILQTLQDTVIQGDASAFIGVGSRKELQELRALYSDPAKLGQLRQNVDDLGRNNVGLLNWSRKVMGTSMDDLRRSFVSGQLGGKYYPNVRYQMENIITAPIISSITTPGANRVILQPYLRRNFMSAGRSKAAAMDPQLADTRIPGSRYTYRQAANGLRQKNIGSTQQSINLGDVIIEDVRQEALRSSKAFGKNNIILEQIDYNLRNFGGKASYSSPGMRLASDVDYAFRENLYYGALQDGRTIDEAAQLAKTAYLDYGALPDIFKKKYARALLYFSFTYRTGVETAKALFNPKAAAQLARLARAHTAMAQYYGAYNYVGDQTLQSLWLGSQDGLSKDADENYRSVNLYYRDPWMGQLMKGAEALTYINQYMEGDPEVTPTRTMQGILDYVYIPFFDILQDLDPDYKKGVPPKTMYRILKAQQMAGMIPEWTPDIIQAQLPNEAEFYFDRYDLEVRPVGKMVPGSPTFNNYQYRFGSQEGYNRFVLDTNILAAAGAKRMADDATGMMIAAGLIPPGSEFGYLENGNPVLYLFFRQSPMQIPKDWEMMDRRMRAQQYRLKELQRTFGETQDTKAGSQK